MADLRFQKSRRLTAPEEFARVKADGVTQRGTLMSVGVLQADEAGPARFGFVTSRRVGNAVERNRVRRRLREIARRHQHGVRAGAWVVTIGRAAAVSASYAALEAEWLRLADRASILRA